MFISIMTLNDPSNNISVKEMAIYKTQVHRRLDGWASTSLNSLIFGLLIKCKSNRI